MSAEPFETNCPYCGETVVSYWVKGGGCLSYPQEYTLVADWIFHASCWDKLVEDYEAAETAGERP